MNRDTQRVVLANLRHELRTPINAISGYSEMLLEDLDPNQAPELERDLHTIHECGAQLLSRINAMLDPRRIEDASFELDISAFDLRTPLDGVKALCERLVGTVDSALLPDLGRIRTAAQRLEDVLSDLEAVARQLVQQDDEKTGDGQSAASPVGGSSAKLESPDWALTDDTADTIRELQEVDNGHRDFQLARILVVDDNENNRDLLSRYLARQGHTVAVAEDGPHALEMMAADNYDLVLLDVLMPAMNGYQVLKRLKMHQQWHHIPVIMVSALDELDSVVRCIEAGAEDYLPKPFNPTLLKARVGASLEKKQLRDREAVYLAQVEAYSAALKKELDKGREIQKNFLPARLPEVPGWEFAAFFKPARQVAGDFYDFFPLDGGLYGLVIADVCDKGVGAALFMGLFRSLTRLFAGGLGAQVGTVGPADRAITAEAASARALHGLRLVNDYIAENHGDLGMFATMFFGVLDPATGTLTYCNGGHEIVFVVGPSGGIRAELPHNGPAVGMMPAMTFELGQVRLEPGEVLLGYTDGVPEARDTSGAFFTRGRLVELLQAAPFSAASLVDRVAKAVVAHTGQADQFDDITLLAVRGLGPVGE